MQNIKITQLGFLLLFISGQSMFGQNKNPNSDNRQESVFQTDVPIHPFDIILGRPTNNSITLSVLFYKPVSGYVEYWMTPDKINKSGTYEFNKNKPTEIILDNLQPNKRYFYRLIFRQSEKVDYSRSTIFHFQTQRSKDDNFTFTITADSHLDENADILTYKTTLLNAASDSADFHVDLGDTFMTDKYRANYKDALNQYIAQRYYFGLLCSFSPLFLVQGNHDGESGQRFNGSADNMTVWSTLTRKTYFPTPVPNEFYTGNNAVEPFVGLPQDFYSWEWGNALFIVLDPFRYTPGAGKNDPWARTLGNAQYDWLKKTLEKSHAAFKFVLIHNLVGGVDAKGIGRGGVEIAGLYEWGGKNWDGSDGFKTHLPDWEMPIHDLFIKYKVNVVFHGHDHLFAKQESDGIIYQCLSQPGSKEHGKARQAEEYGYTTGDILNEPGYMRVKVKNDKVFFEFVTTNTIDKLKNKTVCYSYDIKSAMP